MARVWTGPLREMVELFPHHACDFLDDDVGVSLVATTAIEIGLIGIAAALWNPTPSRHFPSFPNHRGEKKSREGSGVSVPVGVLPYG